MMATAPFWLQILFCDVNPGADMLGGINYVLFSTAVIFFLFTARMEEEKEAFHFPSEKVHYYA